MYVGVTNRLRRLEEHKQKTVKGFTAKYGVDQLLYLEEFSDVADAIESEKRIEGWNRKKKLELIRSINPKFEDLSKNWEP